MNESIFTVSNLHRMFLLALVATFGITPFEFADATEGIYWYSNDMIWSANNTHIYFPGTARPPVPLKRIRFLSGTIPSPY